MKNFIIVIIQLCGIAFIIVSFVAILNYYFGWHIGMYGEEVPADPAFGAVFLILGIILSVVGHFLNKKVSV
jgi:hypothetical protein